MRRLRTFAGLCASITFSLMFVWFVCERSIERQIQSQAQFQGFPKVSIGSIRPSWRGFKIENLTLSNQETEEVLSIELMRFDLSLGSFLSRQFELITISGLKLKTDPKHIKSYLFGYFDESSQAKSHIRHLNIKGEAEFFLGHPSEGTSLRSPLNVTYDHEVDGAVLHLDMDMRGDTCSGRTSLKVEHHGPHVAIEVVLNDWTALLNKKHYELKSLVASIRPEKVNDATDVAPDIIFEVKSDPLTMEGQPVLRPSAKFYLTHIKDKARFSGVGTLNMSDNPLQLKIDSTDTHLLLKLLAQDISADVLHPLLTYWQESSSIADTKATSEGRITLDLQAKFPFKGSYACCVQAVVPAFLGKLIEATLHPQKSGELILKLRDVSLKNDEVELKNLRTNLHFSLFPFKSHTKQRIQTDLISYKGAQFANLTFDFAYNDAFKPHNLEFSLLHENTEAQDKVLTGPIQIHSFRDDPLKGTTFFVSAKGVEARDMLPYLGLDHLSIEGAFTGQGQFVWDTESRLKLLNAKFYSSSSKGRLQYKPSHDEPLQLTADVDDAKNQKNADVAGKMLKNLYFTLLSVEIVPNGDELYLTADITGFNPDQFRGHPFRFQVKSILPDHPLPNPLAFLKAQPPFVVGA